MKLHIAWVILKKKKKKKVKAIVGMHYYGCKKQLQYQVHWKDYSNAEDTWEPKENIHTPRLIEQYHQRQGMSIKATKIPTSNNMFPDQFPKSQSEIPEQLT